MEASLPETRNDKKVSLLHDNNIYWWMQQMKSRQYCSCAYPHHVPTHQRSRWEEKLSSVDLCSRCEQHVPTTLVALQYKNEQTQCFVWHKQLCSGYRRLQPMIAYAAISTLTARLVGFGGEDATEGFATRHEPLFGRERLPALRQQPTQLRLCRNDSLNRINVCMRLYTRSMFITSWLNAERSFYMLAS